MELRNQKAALAMLLQRGSVGDDLWQRFQRGEKEMEDEVRDVIAEVGIFFPILFLVLYVHAQGRDIDCSTIGKCLLSQLGPNYLPIRQRNDEQRSRSRTHRSAPGQGFRRAPVVGSQEDHHSGRVHEGIGR